VSSFGSLRDEAPPDPPQVEELLTQFSGRMAFDIGANVGRTAAVLASRFDRVIALEPAQESFDVLSDRMASYPNVLCLPQAVSDKCDDIELVVASDKIDTGQLVTSDWPEWGKILERRRVSAVTIDALAETFDPPDLIKCDVEGHEVLVISGGLLTIDKYRPALYLEVHNADLGAQLRNLLDVHYSDLHEVWHPHYKSDEWGAKNHYWLVADHG
jgi:FkbM family methyltransferase